MNDTRKLHRKLREMLGPEHTRTLGEAIRYTIECVGGSCRVVESEKTCGPTCACSPCSDKRAGKALTSREAGRVEEAHGPSKAAALLRTAMGRARQLLDRQADGDGALTVGGDVVDHVPAASLKSDLRRKKALQKVMGPDDTEADSKFPEQVDAWQTDEGEVPPGILSGDPVTLEPLADRASLKRRKGAVAEAVAAFEEGMGGGYGMADRPTRGPLSTTLPGGEDAPTPAGDAERLQPDSAEVNLRYARDPARSCGTCRHFRAPGSCELVAGLVRPVDVCDLWEAKGAPEATFDREYGDN